MNSFDAETIPSTEPPLRIGAVELPARAILAPMSGVTDRPFRRLAMRLGAGLVVSEMVAGGVESWRAEEQRLRADGEGITPHVVQIVGNEPGQLADAVRIAEGAGADVIDINMGCPAKRVVRGFAGSSLMRDPDLALRLVETVVGATSRPVTLKMRLGWDERTRTAARIAKGAADAGIRLLTVHGRTRCQFFHGAADWEAIAEVASAVAIPVVANGDLVDPGDAQRMRRTARAAAVMIGRAAIGRPWIVGQAGDALAGRRLRPPPTDAALVDLVLAHYEDMLGHHGREAGVRLARKHLAAYLDANPESLAATPAERTLILRAEAPAAVIGTLHALASREWLAAA